MLSTGITVRVFRVARRSNAGFVEKQGNPLPGRSAVISGAADEFDFAGELFDQARLAEAGQGFVFVRFQPSQEM